MTTADIDSLASAIAFSYFSSQTPSQKQHVALVQTLRPDLYLRPENVLALSTSAVDSSSLLTLDDLPSDRIATLGASFALVDHNRLLPMFGDARVVAIIDHHADEGFHLDALPRIIRVVGSCASLVVDYLGSATPVPGPLADLLLAAILIDTQLRPTPEGKATSTDISSAASLLPTSSLASDNAVLALSSRTSSLLSSKADVGWMNGRDLLRRDYKEYELGPWRYGLSTVPLSFGAWLEKGTEGWGLVEREVEEWMKERKLSMAGVLTSFNTVPTKEGKKAKHQRELLLFVDDARLASILDDVEKEPELKLEGWKGGKPDVLGKRWRIWQQGNARATRKQVAPIIKRLVTALL